MQKYKDCYKLSTGKIINPNQGVIGLSEEDEFKIYEGYDGSFLTKEDDFADKEEILTDAELEEIALYMSSLWLAYANKLKNNNVHNEIETKTEKESVYCFQMFYKEGNDCLDQGRPRVFFGKHAKQKANEYVEKFCNLNGLTEVKHARRNIRLFRSGNNFIELYELNHEYYVHNCNALQ